MLFLLAACVLKPPSAEDSGADTDPAVPTDCTVVTGSASVAIVWRADLTVLVPPAETPTGTTAATSLAGPDALGRYYLTETSGVVKRSDDGGCTWAVVGELPGGFDGDTGWDTGWSAPMNRWDLSVGPDRIYASTYPAGDLYWSTDGAEWTLAGNVQLFPQGVPTVDAADAMRLRAYGPDGIVTSTDGGATWAAVAPPAIDGGWFNIAIDPTDLDRIALNRRELYVATDGATWVERSPNGAPTWDAGVLYTLHYGEDDGLLQASRSDDLGVSFTDLPIDTDPHAGLQAFAADGGLFVSGGYRYDSGSGDGPDGLVQLTTEAGTTVHHLEGYEGLSRIAFGDDRVLVAFEGPSVMTPD